MTDTWEERMAAKAKDRKDAEWRRQHEIDMAEYEQERENFIESLSRALSKAEAELELEYANNNQVGCACNALGWNCCQIRYQAALRVVR